MHKSKERWARLTEAEQARVEDLALPIPEDLPKLARDAEGWLWSPVAALTAYRSQHTSGE